VRRPKKIADSSALRLRLRLHGEFENEANEPL